MPFLYDDQIEAVQSFARQSLAAVLAAIPRLLTAPGDAALVLAQDLPALADCAPDDQAGYVQALATLLADYVAAIVSDASTAPTPAPAAGYQFASRLPPTPADPSYGLAGLAAIGGSLIPAGLQTLLELTGSEALGAAVSQIGLNWQALAQLVEGNATTALATLYAQTEFAASADAIASREQLFGLITAQIALAAGQAAGMGASGPPNDPLVMAWRGLFTASVGDLTARASGLPDVAVLTVQWPLPALYLAELLYQDGTQAAALVQRNAAPHPLFMPLSVEYLAAA